MTNLPMIRLWRGRQLSELSKDELIEAVEWLGDQLAREHEYAISTSRQRAERFIARSMG